VGNKQCWGSLFRKEFGRKEAVQKKNTMKIIQGLKKCLTEGEKKGV